MSTCIRPWASSNLKATAGLLSAALAQKAATPKNSAAPGRSFDFMESWGSDLFRLHPRLAALAVEVLVRILVADELLFHRVPAQFAAGPARDVAEVAKCRRAVANLDIGNGLGARLDAVEPVLLVIVVEIGRTFAKHINRQLVGIGFTGTAGDRHAPLLAAAVRTERKPAGVRPRQVEVLVERHFGIRSAPHVPIQLVRDRLSGQVA